MSYDNKERRMAYGSYRSVMDIVMGLLYTLVGVALVYSRVTKMVMPDFLMDIPAFIIYLLGAMMMIGGSFRFYRGIKDASRRKKGADIQ